MKRSHHTGSCFLSRHLLRYASVGNIQLPFHMCDISEAGLCFISPYLSKVMKIEISD